jgi:two-component system, chemotaxis family, protein-glutamate methylesterase/glutaminase
MALNADDDRLGVIVLGASAGGVDALSAVVAGLPPEIPAAVCVVLHLAPQGKSVLPHILESRGELRAKHPADHEPLQRGMVYVAPPDFHLVVDRGWVRLTGEPRENGLRPSVDTLFRSAAQSYGPRVIGVVLSGTLDDGTAGLMAIKNHGGVAIVQDPEEAPFPSMPLSAVRFADPDHVVPLEKIPGLLMSIAEERTAEPPHAVADVGDPPMDEQVQTDDASADAQPGEPSEFTCPECGGTLWVQEEGDFLRFRCRVGHAYSTESLLADQRQALEGALWAAVVALEERADLAKRLSNRMHDRGRSRSSARFEREASDARDRAGLVRDAIIHLRLPVDVEESVEDG